MIYSLLTYALATMAGAVVMGWTIVLLSERTTKIPAYDHDGIDYELRRDVEDWGRLPRADWRPVVDERIHTN